MFFSSFFPSNAPRCTHNIILNRFFTYAKTSALKTVLCLIIYSLISFN